MSGLLGAIQFLTRVPLRLSEGVPHGRVVPWFPIVGALIGAVVGGVAALAVVVLDPTVAAALGVVAGLVVTGAFHEDGLADVADAFGGGWTVEQRLEILKDSRHGTYGVSALVSSILVRVVALAALTSPAAMVAGAVAAHALSRSAAVAAMAVFPLAVESGLGAGAARSMRPATFAAGILGGPLVALVAVGWLAGPAGAAALLALLVVGRLAVVKIGGLAGDVLGAVEQVAEAGVLVTLAALVGAGHGPWWS